MLESIKVFILKNYQISEIKNIIIKYLKIWNRQFE